MEYVQSILSNDDQAEIFRLFREHSLEKIDTYSDNQLISFKAVIHGKTVGYVVVNLFWGQLYVKYLIVYKEYRLRGIGSKLMQKACEFARENGCTIVFLRTFNFQAPFFYQKLGFKVNYIQKGFKKDISIYHLSMAL
jgi:ribosomal protein S18 acetylase RimI-like enzyme